MKRNLKPRIKATFVTALFAAVVLSSCASNSEENQQDTSSSASTTESSASVASGNEDWLTVPSLKEVFVDSGILENIGFAVPSDRLSNGKIMEGLKYHATSITLENEFKPDPTLGVYDGKGSPSSFESFTSTKGVEIDVPKDILSFSRSDRGLAACKKMGIKMRGHVLVWHSQTPSWFFREDYNSKNPLVTPEVMDARQEWYIKSVLEHVKAWEDKNNGGERIIYAWDVVNEALADDATGQNWIRGSTAGTKNRPPSNSGSEWYQVYGSDEFIINAFRYANKYAPSDVLLCYNDYNEYMGEKHRGMVKLVTKIKEAENDEELPARINVIGMQSHMGANFPSPSAVENAIIDFVGTGLDIHVTELDLVDASGDKLKELYNEYFKMYRKYAKTSEKNGVSGVTLWGINDENSWVSNNGKNQPLLFKLSGGKYVTKEAYYGVIEAAQ